MKRLILIFLSIAALNATLSAQAVSLPKHEIRVGWGDMGFEKAAFRTGQTNTGYRYAGHFFAGYRYSFNNWLSAGFDADFSTVNWKENGVAGHNFANISLLPSARFTYCRKGIVTMYSGIGVGVNVNTGSETDYKGRKTIAAPAFNPVFYGISLNWKQFFAAFELGCLVSLNSKNEIFMLGSRLISISIGCRL